ncbi:MAG: response regulator [Lachnospiraceae bacterium]|nr:response regulator [Lachnospiraceae bacterium]
MKKNKTVLIVDDSEIDRVVLRNILGEDFEIEEAENGYSAMEEILRGRDSLDAILLDVSMPVLDGFGVLRLMKEKEISDIPVFLITAEATKDNVERAVHYNVTEFIRKPFDKDSVLDRVKLKLGVVSDYTLTDHDIEETTKYIVELKALYDKYLLHSGKALGHYERVSAVLKILLNEYSASSRNAELDGTRIDIISKAGYFYNIGSMVLAGRDGRVTKKEDADKEAYQSHTILGADLVRLNYSRHCRFFVQVCADMCIHHHERYDGKGFPHKIMGDNNLIYTQLCRLANRFDSVFSHNKEYSEMQFEIACNEVQKDKGAVCAEAFKVLERSKSAITLYYQMLK